MLKVTDIVTNVICY